MREEFKISIVKQTCKPKTSKIQVTLHNKEQILPEKGTYIIKAVKCPN